MDPDVARQMFEQGGTLVLLGMPVGTEFGIDLNYWNIGERFKGVKMIPPGIHFIYFSAVNRQGDTAPRTGFFHVFEQREVLVRHYDPASEDLISEEVNPDEVASIQANLRNLDRHLGAYPLESWSKWVSLTQHITPSELHRMLPLSGKICSAPVLITVEDNKESIPTKSLGEEASDSQMKELSHTQSSVSECDPLKSSTSSASNMSSVNSTSTSTSSPSSTTTKPTKTASQPVQQSTSLATAESMNNDASTSSEGDSPNSILAPRKHKKYPRMPEMIPQPGTEVRFTKFPVRPYREGATPSEVTQNCLDSTYSVRQMIEGLEGPNSLISELQLAFVTFLVGQVWEGWEQWRALIMSLCRAQKLLEEEPQLYDRLISVLHFQISEVPEDLFVDIVESNNFLASALATLFANISDSSTLLPHALSRKAQRFRVHISAKFDWNLSLEDNEEDAPVIVEL